MKKIRYIALFLLLLMGTTGMLMAQNADSTAVAASSEQNQTEDISVNELVFGHIGDAYEWHIATLGNTVVSIPLPVIVHSSTGWHVFSSSRLEEGEYEGLYIARGGAYDGKIVERNEAGEEVRPLDISITKNVMGLFINSAVFACHHDELCALVQETSGRARSSQRRSWDDRSTCSNDI